MTGPAPVEGVPYWFTRLHSWVAYQRRCRKRGHEITLWSNCDRCGRWPSHPAAPTPPTDVRLTVNGTTYRLDETLKYAGYEYGVHHWTVVGPAHERFRVEEPPTISAGQLPARTAVRFWARPDKPGGLFRFLQPGDEA